MCSRHKYLHGRSHVTHPENSHSPSHLDNANCLPPQGDGKEIDAGAEIKSCGSGDHSQSLIMRKYQTHEIRVDHEMLFCLVKIKIQHQKLLIWQECDPAAFFGGRKI